MEDNNYNNPKEPSEIGEPVRQEFTRDERRIYAFAALKAALLIGLAFVVGLGLVILLLTKIWS